MYKLLGLLLIGLFFTIPVLGQPTDAEDWIDSLIQNKNKHYIYNQPHYQFKQYEKFSISAIELDSVYTAQNHLDPSSTGMGARIIGFLENKLTDAVGQPRHETGNTQQWLVALKETFSDEYRQKKPQRANSTVRAIRQEGLANMITTEKIDALLNEGLKQVNLFDNNINLLYRRFVSPISSVNTHPFYSYSLKDDVCLDGVDCKVIHFAPKNRFDLCFYGDLYVSTDGNYLLRKAVLNVPMDINLNFVAGLTIIQDYAEVAANKWGVIHEIMNIELSLFKRYYGIQGYNERFFSDYRITDKSPITFGFNDEVLYNADAKDHPDSLWQQHRPSPLNESEQQIGSSISDLGSGNKLYDVLFYLGESIVNNSLATGKPSKFDIGPVFSMISYNEAEGVKLRLGGRTTSALNKNWYFSAYGAYGLKDHRWMYSGQVDYFFKDKNYQGREFPFNNISFLYQYDVKMPGQNLLYTDPNNIFLSPSQTKANKFTYLREGKLWIEKQYPSGFYWKVWGTNWNEAAAATLRFQDAQQRDIGSYNQTEAGLELQWSFNERYHQSRTTHLMLRRDGPVFTLSHAIGLKGVFGSQYKYHHTEFGIQKRFWLYGFGHLTAIARGGKLWGEASFPLLILPNANKSYTIQAETYSLMNVLEFINDSYLSLDMQYNMDGLLFNRIGCLRSLKLREVFTFKSLWGNLSDRNNPAYNPELFLFPKDSYIMKSNIPYMEVSVGIENIIRFLRVDYVRRLSYLDHPNIQKDGFRFTFQLSF